MSELQDPNDFSPKLAYSDEERKAFRELVIRTGEQKCPCCTQIVRTYEHKFTNKFVRMLEILFDDGKLDNDGNCRWFKASDDVNPIIYAETTKYPTTLSHMLWWGLIERKPREEGEDKFHTGTYRLTPLGRRFWLGESSIPSYVVTLMNEVVKESNDYVFINDIRGVVEDTSKSAIMKVHPIEGEQRATGT